MNKDYIILNPDYLLRNDTDRIVLYSGKQVQEYSSSEWISYIHPVQAMILSIFSEENILSGKSRHRRCFVKVIKAYGKAKWDYPDPRCIYAPKVKSKLIGCPVLCS